MIHIKICGLTSLDDALAAVEAGADTLGFNFYPQSARYIHPQACAAIAAAIKARDPQVTLVGVFVNSPVEAVQNIRQSCGLDLAQLHGDETSEMLAQLKPHAFKAFRRLPVDINPYLGCVAPALLLDASVQGSYGGTGVTADWSTAAGLAKRYPLLLAGGLNPQNVSAAVQQVRPWGVDVASGVEATPGIKDATKMKAFVQAVRRMESQV